METKLFSILDVMVKNQKSLTAKDLSEKLGISTRTLMRYMSILQNLEVKSFKLIASRQNGYSLEIIDEDEFFVYMNKQRHDLNLTYQNIEWILKIGLEELVTIRDLEERYNYSYTSILRMIQQINDALEDKEIKIERLNNQLKLAGNEVKIRNYLTIVLINHQEYIYENQNIWNYYLNNIMDLMHKHNLRFDSTINITYMVVSLIRILHNYQLSFNEIFVYLYAQKDDKLIEFKEDLNKIFGVTFSKEESLFLELILFQTGDDVIDYDMFSTQIKPMVESALKYIDSKYNTYFENNFKLVEAINYHITNSFSNYIIQQDEDNALIEEIKTNFTNEYCYAIEFKNWFYSQIEIEMGDDDIGYIALHFANGYEYSQEDKSLKAQILYKDNRTLARLLKTRIEQRFPNVYVEQLTRTNNENCGLEGYDLNFVFEEQLQINKGICKVSPFVNSDDIQRIETEILKIQGSIVLIEKIKEELFHTNIDCDNKKEFLEPLLKKLTQKDYLSIHESEQLQQRERLSSTEIVNSVAFPHVVTENESFISFNILKTPIFWKNNFVKVVVLMGLSKNDNSTRKAIQFLFHRLASKYVTDELVKIDDFENLIALIKGENLC